MCGIPEVARELLSFAVKVEMDDESKRAFFPAGNHRRESSSKSEEMPRNHVEAM